ncbi:MAG: DUF2231 domain-containing protein [Desulforhopalus sp.]
MSDWECSVCGYVHKEEESPEKCPVCEAPAQMFSKATGGKEKTVAPAVNEATVEPAAKNETVEPEATGEKRWRCIVCGYVHTGEEPPEKCPVCDAPKNMFEEIDAEGKSLGKWAADEEEPVMAQSAEKGKKPSSSLFDKFVGLSLKFHLHPITVHFPNGILPAVVVFLGLSVYFNIVSLETAAYYNLIFVLLMLPMVLLTGFIEWQKRYRGAKTAIFITKIICSLIVLALVNVLVFWRLLDPAVAAEGSPSRLIYLGIAGVMLGTVGIAGHLGGKLVFGSRGN